MFSIITPVFNEERYLETMIASVRRQTVSAWELILVDDGSSDRTADLCLQWASADSRIRIASHGLKVGKVEAFNLAYSLAVGDLICHVGGDDVLPADSLATRAQALDGAPRLAVLMGKLQVIDANGSPSGRPIPRGSKGSQSSPGATYTRDLADVIFPIPPTLPSEDIWLGNAAVGCAEAVLHTDRVVTHYRVHGQNSNPRGKSFDVMSEAIAVRMEAIPMLMESHLPLNRPRRDELARRWELELLRRDGATLRILTAPGHRIVDRLACASMSNRRLWSIRKSLGVRASGWRGR